MRLSSGEHRPDADRSGETPLSGSPAATATAGKKQGFFGRIRDITLAQLRQGVTPHKLALTVALASTLSLFPVLGTTTVLCVITGTLLRLNHPLMQIVNYAMSGVQLLMIIPFLKAGHWLGAPPLELSLEELQAQFQAMPLKQTLAEFGWIALGGIAAWAVVAPFLIALLYGIARPLFARIARRRAMAAAPA